MLYLENYQWELRQFNIGVSYVNVSKCDTEKLQISYTKLILWPIKIFKLLSSENPLFLGKNSYCIEKLLILAKKSPCHILGN